MNAKGYDIPEVAPAPPDEERHEGDQEEPLRYGECYRIRCPGTQL